MHCRLGYGAALGFGVPAAVLLIRVWDRHWLLAGDADLQSGWPAGEWAAVVFCSPDQALHAGGLGGTEDRGLGEHCKGCGTASPCTGGFYTHVQAWPGGLVSCTSICAG